MKIVRIFADRLFVFHYPHETNNEFERLMGAWTDVSYLHDFAKKNEVVHVNKFIENILQNAEEIQDYLENINRDNEPYGFYFEPLQISEQTKILAFQKGKIRRNQLRFYAIKIDDNCFVITGGAIKMSKKMQEHPDTDNELKKLREARAFLNKSAVFDEDSFFELLSEQK